MRCGSHVCREQKLAEKPDCVHRNPVQRRLITRPDGWSWSSARHFVLHYATGEEGAVELNLAGQRVVVSGLVCIRWSAAAMSGGWPQSFCLAVDHRICHKVDLSPLVRNEKLIGLHHDDGVSNPLEGETCTVVKHGELLYGAGDEFQCGKESKFECASEDCVCCPCALHAQRCPTCDQLFCKSYDSSIWTCFDEHLTNGRCQTQILRLSLNKLANALSSDRHSDLEEFVNHNSDGMGSPLLPEVPDSLALAIACVEGRIPDYSPDVLIPRDEARRKLRAKAQRQRRARTRRNISIAASPVAGTYISACRNSTIYLATAALMTKCWTGRWHYREQNEILSIMGLSQNDDFIRDRVDYFREHSLGSYHRIESQASALAEARRGA
jgi:hypothetical protein